MAPTVWHLATYVRDRGGVYSLYSVAPRVWFLTTYVRDRGGTCILYTVWHLQCGT